jgi:hypothetical protein
MYVNVGSLPMDKLTAIKFIISCPYKFSAKRNFRQNFTLYMKGSTRVSQA